MDRSDADERRRLAVLRSFHVLDTPPEPVLDRLAQLAAHVCETPIAAITLVDEKRQWFKSSVGLDMSQTERSLSFCTHTILGREPYTVQDARRHPLFRDNPLVTGPPHLVFYAGIPLLSPGGEALGALAVMDHVPRTLTDAQLSLLEVLADQVMMHIELRRQQHELAALGRERSRMNAEMPTDTAQDAAAQQQSREHLNLLSTCISRISEIVMITEADPLDEPGPRIVFVNDAFERETGYSREEILGRSPRVLQGPRTQRSELDRIHAALEKRLPVSAELINYTKSGREFWEEIEITPIGHGTARPTHFVAIQRNITERKRKLAELAQTHRALQMLTRCNEAVIKAEREHELLHRICNLAVDVGGYRMAWVGYAEHDETCNIKPMAYAGSSGDMKDISEITVSWSERMPTGRGPGGRAVREGIPVAIEDIGADPNFGPWQESAQRRGYYGVICVPLCDRGKPFGILSLHTTEVRPVTEEEIKLLQELTDNLAFGISHVRAQKWQRRIQEAVHTVAAGVSAGSGVAFFGQLARSMVDALDASAAFVARVLPGRPLTIRTLGAVAEGKSIGSFDCVIEGTPFERCFEHETCSIAREDVDGTIPASCPLAKAGSQACAGRRLDNSAGRPVGLLCVLFAETATEEELIESTLRIFGARAAAELERLEADVRIRNQASLLDQAKDAIIVAAIDDGRIDFWNKGAERLFGWTAEEMRGRSKRDVIVIDKAVFDEAMRVVLERGEWAGELRKRRKDGMILTAECHWTLVSDEGRPQSVLAIDTDISQRKAAEREIETLAFYDPLTRLPNRRLLLDRLEHALAICKRNGHTGALLFIDLDNFKSLNDTLGHDKGDLLLQQVARRLEKCARRNNTVARLGGDEFVVMLEDLSKTSWDAAAQAEIVGKKVLAAFTRPFELDGCEHHSTPSIGVALFDDQVGSVDELLKRADLAMYQAKAAGRNTIRFFDPQMQTVINARVALEADLRHGLQQDEFFLHYQPQTRDDGQVTGMEALVRWRSGNRGLVCPAAFIPLAEETGLIVRLGQWVLESVCAQLAAWAARPETAHLTVSVNVSARQFHHPDFVEQVLTVLHNTGVDPQRLKLELTESLLVSNFDDTVAKMTALKAKGVGFSLDDFGTGYSSLSYLKRLPLDQVKIDQSFVKDVLVDSNDAAIARTIVALGQILGLEVVAEGVETEDQRAFLAQHGCRAYQGYLFGRPLPADQI